LRKIDPKEIVMFNRIETLESRTLFSGDFGQKPVTPIRADNTLAGVEMSLDQEAETKTGKDWQQTQQSNQTVS
jgi:hypothetical protein